MASKTRTFFVNGITLTLSALAMKLVSVLFNVYIANRAGSEAMGLFSLLGSVYGLAITFATAGINLGTTRLVSDALGLGDVELDVASGAKLSLSAGVNAKVGDIRYDGASLSGIVTAETHPEFVSGVGRIARKTGVLFLLT